MEHLTIKPDDFRAMWREKNKLYNIYGGECEIALHRIYEELATILNSSDLFSLMVYKCLYDRNNREFALIEINKMFKDYSLSDIYFSITKRLFDDCIFRLLQDYISSKEPALGNCRGVKDIPQCDFIIERYHQFVDSLNVDATPSAPNIDENGCLVVNQGDLFHGTTYSEVVIESIASKGLETGQLHGVEEDGETFCCVDFFKATKDSTAEEICAFGRQYTNGPNQIVFVIKRENLEGSGAMFPNLTDYDAYNENTEEGRQARKLVNVAGLPLDYSTGAAILMGVPPCMISSIIVNSGIENDPQKIELLSSYFPKATIVSRTSGTVIKYPNKNNKDDGYHTDATIKSKKN